MVVEVESGGVRFSGMFDNDDNRKKEGQSRRERESREEKVESKVLIFQIQILVPDSRSKGICQNSRTRERSGSGSNSWEL